MSHSAFGLFSLLSITLISKVPRIKGERSTCPLARNNSLFCEKQSRPQRLFNGPLVLERTYRLKNKNLKLYYNKIRKFTSLHISDKFFPIV